MAEQTSKRTPLAPSKLSPEDYTRAVAGHLKTYEGSIPRIYTDDGGIPTMGKGVALAVRGGEGNFTLRDFGEIGAQISGDPARPYQFTEAEKKLLTDTVGKLNDAALPPKNKIAEAQKLIPPYRADAETATNNKFGFTLSDERIAKQSEAAWAEHRDRAFQTVREQAKARGWSKEETNTYVDSLKGTEQEIALTSLAYNGVKSPKATGAMLDGDVATMRREILYGSNTGGANGSGWAERRKVEADLATGNPGFWTEQQKAQWQDIEKTPAASDYRKSYPKTFPPYDQPQLPTQPAADPAPVGAQQGTDASDVLPTPQSGLVQERKEAPVSPEIAAMTGMSASPLSNPGRMALLKPVETLTQPEMMDMIASAQGDYRGWRAGDPLKAHTYERVQDWHVAMYGDAPQATDGGKPVEPQPIRPIPETPSPHTTPQGEDLWQATGRIGQKVAEAAQGDGIANAVKSLQRGLNILSQANPLPARSPAYGPYTKFTNVAEDGQYGPQTDFALKHATARLGSAKVEDGFALGRFNTFARAAQKSGNADGLEAATHGAIGPLFQTPKVEAGVLQETLNDLGSRSHDDWEALKVDNWIGPKTTAAFGKVLKSEDADSVTAAFGRGLGLL